jgi:hypothetical protein
MIEGIPGLRANDKRSHRGILRSSVVHNTDSPSTWHILLAIEILAGLHSTAGATLCQPPQRAFDTKWVCLAEGGSGRITYAQNSHNSQKQRCKGFP